VVLQIGGGGGILKENPQGQAIVIKLVPFNSRAEVKTKKAHFRAFLFLIWWRRRELNPRPQAFYL